MRKILKFIVILIVIIQNTTQIDAETLADSSLRGLRLVGISRFEGGGGVGLSSYTMWPASDPPTHAQMVEQTLRINDGPALPVVVGWWGQFATDWTIAGSDLEIINTVISNVQGFATLYELGDTILSTTAVPVRLGNVVTSRVTIRWLTPTTMETETVLTIDGNIIFRDHTLGSYLIVPGLQIELEFPEILDIVPPIVTRSDNIDVSVGTPIDWFGEIDAHWGFSTHLNIPSNGEISMTPASLSARGNLAEDLIVASRIGVHMFDYEIRDDHSLSDFFPLDQSFTTTSRKITVHTLDKPTLQFRYHASALTTDGLPVPPGTIYNPNAPTTPTGGEEGWTNQPLDIILDPDTILGTFDSVLKLPDFNTIVTNAIATRTNYHIESPGTVGTPIFGVLSQVGDASNELSAVALGIVKIDTTPPIASATYNGGFSFTDTSVDALSGISTATYPAQIAFTTPVSDMNPPTTGWEDLDNHTMTTQGNYDVWVRATDKAGNEHVVKIFADLFVGGEVSITKNTDAGAVLHEAICQNFASITYEDDCEPACSIGLSPELLERSALTYKLTLTNTAEVGSADGTFEDYLPEGVVVSTMPSVTPAGSATVDYALETLPPYAGRYKVSGTYTGLEPAGQIEIEIQTEVPLFDRSTPINNTLVNQATTDWNINAGVLTGTNESNYATHKVMMPRVETSFTKVGANDISQGLAGVEFVLYRWEGVLAPTIEEQSHIVDYSVLVDNTLAGGDWIRVTYDGEDALALTDIFVSNSSPIGEVDLGKLPKGIYTLIETKAPTGYNLPVGQWILTIDTDKTDSGVGDWKIEIVGKSNSIAPPAAIRDESVPNAPTYKIVNAEPFLIGLSGLGGTTGMLLTGFVLMAIAGNTYFVWKYKHKNKQT